jgi:hypothetical protein
MDRGKEKITPIYRYEQRRRFNQWMKKVRLHGEWWKFSMPGFMDAREYPDGFRPDEALWRSWYAEEQNAADVTRAPLEAPRGGAGFFAERLGPQRTAHRNPLAGFQGKARPAPKRREGRPQDVYNALSAADKAFFDSLLAQGRMQIAAIRANLLTPGWRDLHIDSLPFKLELDAGEKPVPTFLPLIERAIFAELSELVAVHNRRVAEQEQIHTPLQ